MAVIGIHKRGQYAGTGFHRCLLGAILLVIMGVAGVGFPRYQLSDMMMLAGDYSYPGGEEENSGDAAAAAAAAATVAPIEVSSKTAFSTPAPKPTMSDFHLCRVTPAPEAGGPQILMKDYDANNVVSVDYQCAGEPYDDFTGILEDLILSTAREKGRKFWGRRKRILPLYHKGAPPSSTNPEEQEEPERSILIMGNSHTRQLVTTLTCQYHDQLVKPPELLYSMPGFSLYGVQKLTFQKNIVVYASTNCPFVYSASWQWSLHNILTGSNFTTDRLPTDVQPLSFLSAIVLGRFNDYKSSVGTRFVQTMTTFQTEHPEFNMDFQHFSTPRIQDVAAIFEGPIIFVSMFANYGNVEWRDATKSISQEEMRHRDNLYILHGRQYIDVLHQRYDNPTVVPSEDPTLPYATTTTTTTFPVAECASDGRSIVDTCVTNTSSYRFQNGHRCTGAGGGHPDLIVWDLVDVLWQVFAPSKWNGTSTTKKSNAI